MRKRFLSGSDVFLAVFMAVVLAAFLAGCATGKSGSSADEPGEVMGSVPTGSDAEFHAPPQGPEILRAKSDEAPVEIQGSGEGVADESGVVRRAALNALIGRGPGYVFSQVETKPSHAGQKFVGFELVAMSPAAKQAVGSRVQVGDVITHLNGVQQRTPEDYLRAWKMLGDAKHVQLDLIREGQVEQVIWRVE